jgi:hypothetical protein
VLSGSKSFENPAEKSLRSSLGQAQDIKETSMGQHLVLYVMANSVKNVIFCQEDIKS